MPDELEVVKAKLAARMDWEKFVLKSMREMPVPDLKVPHGPVRDERSEVLVAVAHLSDIQYGKVTQSYNSKVADARILAFGEKVAHWAKVHRAGARVDRLHLYLGGDIVEGEKIFKGQTFSIDQPVYDQAIHGASTALARMVLGLLRHFRTIHITCVRGNHGKDGYDGSPSNWDNVCYEMLKHKLLGGQELFPSRRKLARRVTFKAIGPWYHVDRIFGWGNLIVHGDQFKGSFTGAGFKSKVTGWIDAIPEAWDYLWFGHFHQLGTGVMNRRIYLANGTMESDNDYAQESFAATGSPVQRLAFFNREHGLIADHPIYLNEREANG